MFGIRSVDACNEVFPSQNCSAIALSSWSISLCYAEFATLRRHLKRCQKKSCPRPGERRCTTVSEQVQAVSGVIVDARRRLFFDMGRQSESVQGRCLRSVYKRLR